MSTGALALQVATPLGMQLDVAAESVQVPSVAGELGVLPGHLPLLAALRPGVLRYRREGQTMIAAVGAGFVEADATRVRLLAEFFLRPEEIDVEEARRDLETAEQHLKGQKGPIDEAEHVEAKRSLDWALARLEIAGGPAS